MYRNVRLSLAIRDRSALFGWGHYSEINMGITVIDPGMSQCPGVRKARPHWRCSETERPEMR